MSRSDRLTERIESALRGVKVETSEVYRQDFRESDFGMVNLVTFLWRVAEDDLHADQIAREVTMHMMEKNICVMFHKTRRQQGERLLTAAQWVDPHKAGYSYNNLMEFARNWLIDVTQADAGKKQKNQQRQQFRL